MLVLSRKVNEKIVIDGGIVVTVVKIEGGQVRLGIEAPSQIKVFRPAGDPGEVRAPVRQWPTPRSRCLNSPPGECERTCLFKGQRRSLDRVEMLKDDEAKGGIITEHESRITMR